MLTLLCGTAIIATLSMHAGAQNGVELAYGFDEGGGGFLTDASLNSYVGTLVNGPTWTTGHSGSAVAFDGVDDKVSLPSTLDIATLPFTLEAWVRPTNYSNWRVIFSKRNSYSAAGMRVDVGLANSSGRVYVTTAQSTVTSTYAPPVNTWTHLAVVADATGTRLYVNGALRQTLGVITLGSASGALVNIGRTGDNDDPFAGAIDDLRLYKRALSLAEIQTDMATPVSGGSSAQPPLILTSQPSGTLPSGTTGTNLSVTTNEVATCKYSTTPNTAYSAMTNLFTTTDGLAHQAAASGLSGGTTYNYYVRCMDVDGNASTGDYLVTFTILESAAFVNEWVISQGLSYPVAVEFLPDGRMLVGELGGAIHVAQPGANHVDPTPALQLQNVYVATDAGLLDIKPDPNFATNGYVYVFYVSLAQGTRDRLSRFTMQGNILNPASELVVWLGDSDSTPYHHGAGVAFGLDGKLYFTTGDHFTAANSRDLTKDPGKLMRVNPDGTIPTDNPFYDGAGPNKDSIWAYGLRNPFRLSLDPVTGNLYIGDVGGNVGTSIEEINIGARGANFGWPDCEGPCGLPGTTNPIYSWSHAGRDSGVIGGLVYRGTQFPSQYQGNYFFADYAQNWIRRLTLNPAGTGVTGTYYVDPPDATLDDLSVGDPVDFAVGPDGSLYYVDLDFAEPEGQVNAGGVRRIRYVVGNQPPVAVAFASPATGPVPLQVSFFSTGTSDPDSTSLSYLWDFGDGTSSTSANAVHVYQQNGQFTATLSVSDGTNTSPANPIFIKAGGAPSASISTPSTGATFRAGDVIDFTGTATDPEDGLLPPSAYEWTVNFLHDTHIHPVVTLPDVTSGTLNIGVSGHDYVGNTRYEIVLKVTDSDGLETSTAATVYPEKVALAIDTVPSGLTLKLDGVSFVTPFTRNDLVGFHHDIEAPDQTQGTETYKFSSWSDSGAQGHTIVIPAVGQSYTATYTVVPVPTIPGNLVAMAAGGTQVNLSWMASSSSASILDYAVERCQGTGCISFAQVNVATGTSYANTGLTPATPYSYRVRARDGNNTFSAYSTTATATTTDTVPPSVPTNLTATATSSGQINLAWTASTDNVSASSYRVERCQEAACTSFAEIATPATVSYSNTGLAASTSYSYRVRAADAAGNLGGYSAVATTTTQAPPAAGGPAVALAFNEGTGTATVDASGGGNAGTLVNGPTWTTGHSGSAVAFDGVDDKVSLPSTLDIATLPFTLVAWVRPTNRSNWRVIFSKRNSYSAAGMRVDVGLANSSGRVYVTTAQSTVTSTYAPPLNTWTHLAVVADATGTRLYVNGALRQTLGVITLGTASGAVVNIGRTGDNDDPFAGAIDDLRLYKRALSLAEIQTDMKTPVP